VSCYKISNGKSGAGEAGGRAGFWPIVLLDAREVRGASARRRDLRAKSPCTAVLHAFLTGQFLGL